MIVPRSVFSLAKLCDCESTRYALGCVLFERINDDWCRAVVTDGKLLLVVEWKEDHNFDAMFCNFPINGVPGSVVLIPAESCEALRKLGIPALKKKIPPKCGVVAIEEQSQDGHYEFRACVLSESGRVGYSATTGEGRFPRWKDVVSQYRKARDGQYLTTVVLDALPLGKLMSVIAEVATGSDGKADCGILMPPSVSDPAVVTRVRDGSLRVFALLMPIVSADSSGAEIQGNSQAWWPGDSGEVPKPTPVVAEPATIVGQWREVVSSASEITSQATTLETPIPQEPTK